MKIYIVNDTNLYHLCNDNVLDSLFDFKKNDTGYSCRRCRNKFPEWIFFPFEKIKTNTGFYVFTKLNYTIPVTLLKDFKVHEIICSE